MSNQSHGENCWPPSRNSEVVQTWCNPKNMYVSDDWQKLGAELRVSAEVRKMAGGIRDQAVRHLKYKPIPGLERGIGITACIEKSDDGTFLKHVIIRWLGRTNWDSEATELLRKVSLLFEPKQPAFMLVKGEEDGIYGHLAWPCDWSQADRLWSEYLCKALPAFPNPLFIYPEGQCVSGPRQFQIKISFTFQEFKNRVEIAGIDEWFEMLRQNLFVIGLASAYLDQQTARDLFMLTSMRPDPKGQMQGKVLQFLDGGVLVTLDEQCLFGTRDLACRIHELLIDRFYSCPSCGYISCASPSTAQPHAADFVQKIMARIAPCCQFVAALVYPIKRTWCIVSFEYQCPECRKTFRVHHGCNIQEPAPSLPNNIPGSLISFLKQLTGHSIYPAI
jgi:hypothetical protein